MKQKVCVILGVGSGNGISLAGKFSEENYAVVMCSRDTDKLNSYTAKIENSQAFEYDVTNISDPEKIFNKIREKIGPVDVLIYNAGAGQFANIDNATLDGFQNAWEVNARGLFLAAGEVISDMRKSGGGNIVVIGATASLRGGANFLPFASAKAAQRSLAQSMARKLGPENIHVSYVIIDGVIDKDRKNRIEPDDSLMNPDHIADSVYFLTQQQKSAWTFELDLRPFREKW